MNAIVQIYLKDLPRALVHDASLKLAVRGPGVLGYLGDMVYLRMHGGKFR